MGLLDAIRDALVGGGDADESRGGDAGDPADDAGTDTADGARTAQRAGEADATPAPGADVPADPGELASAFADASGRRRSALGFELVARTERSPDEFAGQAAALAELLDEPADTSRVAAAAFGHVARADLDVAAAHEDALAATLRHADDVTRDHAAGVLAALARDRPVAVDRLVATVEAGDDGAWQAAEVLAAVATTRPADVPVERLTALLDADDPQTRGCAAYVLAVRAAETDDDHRVETGDYLDTVGDLVAADATGFAARDLLDDAVLRVLRDAAPDADCQRVELAATPMGHQIVVTASNPQSLAAALNADDAVVDTLEARFGLEDPQIDAQAVE